MRLSAHCCKISWCVNTCLISNAHAQGLAGVNSKHSFLNNILDSKMSVVLGQSKSHSANKLTSENPAVTRKHSKAHRSTVQG